MSAVSAGLEMDAIDVFRLIESDTDEAAHSADLPPPHPVYSKNLHCWLPAADRCSPCCRFYCTSSGCVAVQPLLPPETDLSDEKLVLM